MKQTAGMVITLIVAALIVGALTVSVFFPRTIAEEVVKTVEVPKEVIVEKIVEVPIACENEVVEVDTLTNKFADAKAEYLAEVEDEKELQYCNEERYDFEQITLKEVKEYTVNTDVSRRDTATTVAFEAELKFVDKDTEEKCYRDDKVEVVFHSNPNKDTEISVD